MSYIWAQTCGSHWSLSSSNPHLVRLQCLGLNRFFIPPRGTHHWVPRSQRLFGGQIVGQALVAAAKSVGDNLFAHSLHCYFVRAGKTGRRFLKGAGVRVDARDLVIDWMTISCRRLVLCHNQCNDWFERLATISFSTAVFLLLPLQGIRRFQCCTRWNARETAAVSPCAPWRPSSMGSLSWRARPPSTCCSRVPCSTSSPCRRSRSRKTSSRWRSSFISISGQDGFRNVWVPTFPCSRMSVLRNFQVPISRMSESQNYRVTEYPRSRISVLFFPRNDRVPECLRFGAAPPYLSSFFSFEILNRVSFRCSTVNQTWQRRRSKAWTNCWPTRSPSSLSPSTRRPSTDALRASRRSCSGCERGDTSVNSGWN